MNYNGVNRWPYSSFFGLFIKLALKQEVGATQTEPQQLCNFIADMICLGVLYPVLTCLLYLLQMQLALL